MKVNKRIIVSAILLVCTLINFSHSAFPVMAKESNGKKAEENGVAAYTYEIKGKANLKNYLEEMGEPYDPDLLAVQRTIYLNPDDEISPCDIIFLEYIIRKKYVTTKTDTSSLLKQYKRPAGKVSISESVSINNTFSADVGVSAEVIEAKLGYSFSETKSFKVSWSNTYSYPTTIKVYPIYERTTGELWEDDVWYDDYIGKFTANRAVGDDVRVYRQ